MFVSAHEVTRGARRNASAVLRADDVRVLLAVREDAVGLNERAGTVERGDAWLRDDATVAWGAGPAGRGNVLVDRVFFYFVTKAHHLMVGIIAGHSDDRQPLSQSPR